MDATRSSGIRAVRMSSLLGDESWGGRILAHIPPFLAYLDCPQVGVLSQTQGALTSAGALVRFCQNTIGSEARSFATMSSGGQRRTNSEILRCAQDDREKGRRITF